MQLWIDANACCRAVKEVVFCASARLSIPISLVANRVLATPPSGNVRVVQVPTGSDVADQYIVEHVEAGDEVITATSRWPPWWRVAWWGLTHVVLCILRRR